MLPSPSPRIHSWFRPCSILPSTPSPPFSLSFCSSSWLCFCGAHALSQDFAARTARAAKSNILHSFVDGRQLGATGRSTQVGILWRRDGASGSSFLLKSFQNKEAGSFTLFIGTFFFFFFSHFYFPASGQAVVTGVNPSPRRFLPSIFYRA